MLAHSPLATFAPPALHAPAAVRDTVAAQHPSGPPARPAGPGGTSPIAAGAASAGLAGAAFGGSWVILLIELGLAGCALSSVLTAGSGRRPTTVVSLHERPG
jgi:hypothetical protein